MRTFWHIPTALAVALTALVTFCTSGCSSSSATAKQPAQEAAGFPSGAESRLRAGDLLQVRVETSPNVPPQLSEVTVDEEGYIGLPLIGRIKAEGLTTSELADAIQKAYVPRFYVRCTANVQAPMRYVYIGGEVRQPGRFPWTKDMTLLKAISTAAGFTEFANRGRVELTRGRVKTVYDCEEIRRNPEKDVPIQPGDSIYVPRSIF